MKFPFVSTTNIFNKNYKGKLKNNAKEKQQQRQRKNNKNKIAANKEKVTKTTVETPTLIFCHIIKNVRPVRLGAQSRSHRRRSHDCASNKQRPYRDALK